jgi:hypothetical protein
MAEAKKQAKPSEFSRHMKAAGAAAARQWGSLIPREFWQYRREARREFLLAMRSVVDGAIEHLEKPGVKAQAPAPAPEPAPEPQPEAKPRRHSTKKKVQLDDTEAS